MISDRYEIKESIRSDLGKKLRNKYSAYLHDVSMCAFNDRDKLLGVILFFHTDSMIEQTKADGIVDEIEEFCLKELSQVEWEGFRAYGVDIDYDSHENVVRTNGGNYLMYRR